jgi:hypothetical protein
MNRVYELDEAKIANMEFHTTIKNKLFTYEFKTVNFHYIINNIPVNFVQTIRKVR